MSQPHAPSLAHGTDPSRAPGPSPVVMITGGNRGIGRGITEELLRRGWRVSMLSTRDLDPDLIASLDAVAGAPGRVAHTTGSVAEIGDHQRFLNTTLERFGRLDALVNNAGVAPSQRADLLEASPGSFDRVLDINLRGPYFLTQIIARELIAQRDRDHPEAAADPTSVLERPSGTIINVSSCSAVVVSTNRGEYCVSKAGVAMATQLFAARLAPEGIVVYEVRPGVIATDMTAGVAEKYDRLIAEGAFPIPRWGRPSDIGSVVGMLVEGRAPYSTGEVINVDGGMHIQQL